MVQLYIRDVESKETRPLKELRGFKRVSIKAGQTIAVTMTLGMEELAYYDSGLEEYVVEPGRFDIMVGPSSDQSGLLVTSLLVR